MPFELPLNEENPYASLLSTILEMWQMVTNVLLPQWGMNMEDGTLVKWLVKEGDEVEKANLS